MPKMKTNSAASKRVRVTGSGKLMHAGSAMRHNLEHKSARKRRARECRLQFFPAVPFPDQAGGTSPRSG